MTSILELDVLQAQDISLIDSGNGYSSGKRKAEGKTFSRFRYNGIVFTVPDEHPFVAAHTNGVVASVKLIGGKRTVTITSEDGETEDVEKDTLQFESFTTMQQRKNALLFQVQESAIKALGAKSSEFSEESLNLILNATVV